MGILDRRYQCGKCGHTATERAAEQNDWKCAVCGTELENHCSLTPEDKRQIELFYDVTKCCHREYPPKEEFMKEFSEKSLEEILNAVERERERASVIETTGSGFWADIREDHPELCEYYSVLRELTRYFLERLGRNAHYLDGSDF